MEIEAIKIRSALSEAAETLLEEHLDYFIQMHNKIDNVDISKMDFNRYFMFMFYKKTLKNSIEKILLK